MKIAAAGLLVLLMVPAFARSADERSLLRIKTLYGETAAAISRALKGEEDGLYANELVVNSRNGSWRGSGNYSKKAVFWYADPPEFAAAEGKKGESALAKVEVTETAAAINRYAEFLYGNGELLFVFRRGGDGGTAEERVYLQDGRVIQCLNGSQGAPVDVDPSPLLREAAYWQEMFLLTFGGPAPASKKAHPIDSWLTGCMEKEPSTQGANACLGQALVRWDSEMNRVYRELNGRLEAEKRNTLREAQRAWVAFRDMELAWLGEFYGRLQGSMYGSMLAADRLEVTRKRALELDSLLDVLEQE